MNLTKLTSWLFNHILQQDSAKVPQDCLSRDCLHIHNYILATDLTPHPFINRKSHADTTDITLSLACVKALTQQEFKAP